MFEILHFDCRWLHFVLHCRYFDCRCSDFILHCRYFVLRCSDFILHCRYFVLRCSDFVLHCRYFILRCSDFILHCRYFVLHCSDFDNRCSQVGFRVFFWLFNEGYIHEFIIRCRGEQVQMSWKLKGKSWKLAIRQERWFWWHVPLSFETLRSAGWSGRLCLTVLHSIMARA